MIREKNAFDHIAGYPMGRPNGPIGLVADALDIDQASVRRAVLAAGLDPKTIGYDEALKLAQNIVDPVRVVGHKATRVSSNPAMTDARTRHEELKARQLELQNAKLEGSLIDRNAVTETGARIIAEVRTALLSLGPRIAPKVNAASIYL
jgi:hypothetical protein